MQHVVEELRKALPPVFAGTDPPPLKWSTLSYGFAHKEDQNAKEELQAGRDRRQAAAG